MTTGRDLLKQARASVAHKDPEEVRASMASGSDVSIVDVREESEFQAGHIPGAIHIPRAFFEVMVDERLPNRDAQIVVYCAGGNRSAFATKTLQELGYGNVAMMDRGFSGWKESGFEVEVPRAWTPSQRDRYSRHFVLPEVGEQGQAKIADGRVLVVGAGGLGSPALYYLAAAGVGKLGIVDFDAVEENNLQRQIIHSTSRIGVNKAASAKTTIGELNPDVDVVTYEHRLTDENVDSILEGFDMVIDATDNFTTRYLLNDAAVRQAKPYVYGSIFRFEGYATVFWPAEGGPCYRCMYPEAPPAYLAPT